MLRRLLFWFLLAAAMVASAAASGEGKGRGFGDSYDWKTYEEAFSADNDKPIMVVIHRSWCGACKALGPRFAASTEIAELAREFTLVNLNEDDEVGNGKFEYDGQYIPRIAFLTPKGEDMEHIINASGNPKYKYFYSDASQIVTSMKQALEEVKSKAAAEETKTEEDKEEKGEEKEDKEETKTEEDKEEKGEEKEDKEETKTEEDKEEKGEEKEEDSKDDAEETKEGEKQERDEL